MDDHEKSSVENAVVENVAIAITPSRPVPNQKQLPPSKLLSRTDVSQGPLYEFQTQDCRPLADGPSYTSSARLIVDEEDADYYIVSPAGATDDNPQSIGTDDATLLTLFSRPTDGQSSHARYLRCSSTQLLDFGAWSAEQQRNPIVVRGQSFLQDAASMPVLSNDDKALCHIQLIATLRARSQSQQRMAWLTLYCLANSMRDLARPELVAAVKIGMQITARTADLVPENDQLTDVVERCIDSLGQIIQAQRSGRLFFKNEVMKPFIRQLNFPGVQAGHSTMTRICFEQIKRLGAALIIQPWYLFRRWFSRLSEWPLASYVVSNWFLHYRMAADRPDLDSELYHLLREALLVEMPTQPSILLERRIVDAGYGISQIYHLVGLEAVLRNMGARTALATNSVLGKVPTESQWNRVSQQGRLISMSKCKTLSCDSWCPDDCEIVTTDDDDLDAVVVTIEALSFSPSATADAMKDIHVSDTVAAIPGAFIEPDDVKQDSLVGQSNSDTICSKIDEEFQDIEMVDGVE